jgi:D-methionine transport system ATP-binding protein
MSNLVSLDNVAQLQVNRVSFAAPFGGNLLLDDICFNVNKGEHIGIVGASGSGKTSLLRLLNRLQDPSTGTIYLDHRAYRQIDPMELRRKVVLVLSDPRLLGMSVKEAITYPLKLRGWKNSDIKDRLDYWLEQLNIPLEWLERNELQLSAGQKQIVSIARALVIEPEILLLDEPTSALDAGKSANLLRILAKLFEHKITILMVNHQLDLVRDFCHRVLHLQQGKLIEDQLVTQVNWGDLKKSLVELELQGSTEWE